LKSEGMTDLSEQDFVNKYSDREQLQPDYEWLKENGNTDLEFEPFADKYFPSPKSNEVSGQGSQNTSGTCGDPSQTSQSTSPDQATLAEQSTGGGYVLPEGAVDLTNPEQGIYAYYDPNLVNVDTGEMGDVVNRLEAVDITPPAVHKEREEREPTSTTWEVIKNSVAQVPAIFNEAIFSMPEFLYNFFSMPQNLVADITGWEGLRTGSYEDLTEGTVVGEALASVTSDVADSARMSMEYYQDQIRFESEGVVDALSNGNFLEAGQQLASEVIKTLPTMLQMAVSGGVTNLSQAGKVTKTVANSIPFMSSSYQ